MKTSVWSAPSKMIFERVKALKTLQYIAWPYATFKPVDGQADLVWAEGGEFAFKFKLFGFIPLGLHTIKVLTFDEQTGCILTHEGNAHVPVWNHRIVVKAIDDSTTQYTDEVVIQAGWKTPFVYLWAKAFYAHRQRKWRKLLRISVPKQIAG